MVPTLVGRRKPRATFMMSTQVCVKKNARLKKGDVIENKSGNKAEKEEIESNHYDE